jgi:hypothetical protein
MEDSVNTSVLYPVPQRLNPDVYDAIQDSPDRQDIQQSRQDWVAIMLGRNV